VDAPEVLAEAEDVVEFVTVADGVTGAEKTVGATRSCAGSPTRGHYRVRAEATQN